MIELRPTASQSIYLHRCAGVMRHVYNSLVAKWKSGEKYNRSDYQKFCIKLRQSTPWMREVGCRATYEAADNFHDAISRFFKAGSRVRKGNRKNPPRFKKKGASTSKVNFSHPTQFSVHGRHLNVQLLAGRIAMREFIRFNGTVKSVSIKLISGKWFACFSIKLEEKGLGENIEAQKPRAENVGIDLGLTALATLSTGEVIDNPKFFKRKLKLLRKRQRQSTKKFVKGSSQSNRYKKSAAMVARLHKKILDQRKNYQHAFTKEIVKRFSRIVIEDLSVGNMLKNKRLSSAIKDAGWWSIRQQISYKAKQAGVEVVVADRFYPSSKICSCCGHKMESMPLNKRVFTCPKCELKINRDVNAARNLAAYVPPTPQIRGSRKTSVLDLHKSSSKDGAGLLEGANINLQPRVSAKLCKERMVVIN